MAEDIVQNLFIQLWENKKLDNIENPERFLLRATKYKSIPCLGFVFGFLLITKREE